jgi:hypothetical protein
MSDDQEGSGKHDHGENKDTGCEEPQRGARDTQGAESGRDQIRVQGQAQEKTQPGQASPEEEQGARQAPAVIRINMLRPKVPIAPERWKAFTEMWAVIGGRRESAEIQVNDQTKPVLEGFWSLVDHNMNGPGRRRRRRPSQE